MPQPVPLRLIQCQRCPDLEHPWHIEPRRDAFGQITLPPRHLSGADGRAKIKLGDEMLHRLDACFETRPCGRSSA